MKIVAIDFETANSSMASACSIGISTYDENGEMENFEWLLKPHKRYNYFEQRNIEIHHITKEMVQDEKEFDYYYDKLKEIFKDAILVAHNAKFDMTVLNRLCETYGLTHFPNRYIDTVAVARKVYPELPNHKLNTVSEYIGCDLCHHNACSDSNACLQILLNSMDIYNEYDIEKFMKIIGCRIAVNL